MVGAAAGAPPGSGRGNPTLSNFADHIGNLSWSISWICPWAMILQAPLRGQSSAARTSATAAAAAGTLHGTGVMQSHSRIHGHDWDLHSGWELTAAGNSQWPQCPRCMHGALDTGWR